MGLLADVQEALIAVNARVTEIKNSVADWAGSENGQHVLGGLDFVSVSSKVGDFYSHTGWYLPVHPLLWRFSLEHVETHAPFDARRAADLVGPTSPHWSWITEGALASPSLASRRAVVEDAIFAMEHQRWRAAVSTLLPVIEGLISDRSTELGRMRVGRRLHHILSHETGSIEAISAVPALDVIDSELFAHCEFSDASSLQDALNRHLVLHGRTSGFGTRLNACRVLMFVVALVELFDGPLVYRVASSPDDTGALLDDYGPLAPLRRAAAQRALRQ